VPESAVIIGSAVLVGVGTGLASVLFQWLIERVQTLAYDGLGGLLSSIAPLHLLVIPALGGALFGPLVYWLAQEARGAGVAQVMEATALEGGYIRPRVAVVKLLAASLCIGTGGSAGRQGPIVQIGATLGSTVGQALRLTDARLRNLVACGAAGGIAATMNAPIAGALFALEVILGQLHTLYFSAVVISAVTADIVVHGLERELRTFAVPAYALVSPWELLLYALLGMLAGGVAVGFGELLRRSEALWAAIHLPEYIEPAAGGVLLGLLGILTFKVDGFPRVFGVGYDSINQALFGQLALGITLALLWAKMLATVLTLGAGGSGGVFAPLLFMGAMLGAAFGQVAHDTLPRLTAPAGAYALVGMAAFFSGATHAPVTSILIIFEMTGNYDIILPLMLTSVISTLVSRHLRSASIYTYKLEERGLQLPQGQDIDMLEGVTISIEIPPGAPAAGQRVGALALPEGCLLVSVRRGRELRVAHGHTILQAGDRIALFADKSCVPLLRKRLLGARAGEEIERRPGARYRDFRVPQDAPCVDQPVRALALAPDCILVSIRRGDEVIIPHGDTRLRAGDVVEVFGLEEKLDQVEERLLFQRPKPTD